MRQLLGTGLLSWPSYERHSGRYGIIALFRFGEREEIAIDWATPVHDLVGTWGTLIAVLDGLEYPLGSGTFFTELAYGIDYVGVKPDVARDGEWLNVENLYKVDGMLINQTVELHFEEV